MSTSRTAELQYETVELLLTAIPHFQFKQKKRILQLFAEIYNTFIQEIHEVLQEKPSNFQFQSQSDGDDEQPVDLSSKKQTEFNTSIEIKKESFTPRKSKTKRRSSSARKTPLRQMTMTELFNRRPSPNSPATTIKKETSTPSDDTSMFIPESLVGLAQPSASDQDDEQANLSDLIMPLRTSDNSTNKRKSTPSEMSEDDDEQNNAILPTPFSVNDNEELLYACPMCRNYWLGLPESLRHAEGFKCRHRQRPLVQSPEHFWSLGIPSTQTCIQRGYGGVLPPTKPVERPRRPRRQQQQRPFLHDQHENDS